MIHQHHYNVSGTQDSSDLQKIKEALLKHPVVKAVEISSEPATISITVEAHPDLESLQKSVLTVGNFTLSERTGKPNVEGAAHSHDHSHHHHDSNHEVNDSESRSRGMPHEIPSSHSEQKNGLVPAVPDHAHSNGHSGMDHSKMDHSKMPGGHAGHDHSNMINDFKKRFWLVAVLTVPIVLLSPMIQHWLEVDWQFTGSTYILFALSAVVFFYGGWPFLTGWWQEMKIWKLGMMTLIGFAISVAFIYSVATVFGLAGMDFFWELTTLILIMLLGHWIEMRSIAGASRELELLVQLMPSEAHLVHGDHIMDIKTEDLKENDIILIKPGEKVAADGVIVDGESYLNESMLTGESKPVQKVKTNKVIAGSLNGNGSLRIQVSHGAKDSYLSQVIKLVRDAQNSKSNTQLLADRAAR